MPSQLRPEQYENKDFEGLPQSEQLEQRRRHRAVRD